MAALRGCVASSSRSAISASNMLRSATTSSARATTSSSSSSAKRLARFSTSSPPRQAAAQAQRSSSSSDATPSSTSNSSAAPPLSSTGSNPALSPYDTTEEMQQWYRRQYPASLALPDDVLLQTFTHESYDQGMGKSGHNRRLAFLGRRAMYLYLSLFLHSQMAQAAATSSSSSASSASAAASSFLSSTDQLEKLLQTSRLGDSVGRSLKLEQVMRWRPAVSDGQAGPKEIGLFKIRGTTVEALIGAIYHQHGAAAAQAFFGAKVLPELGTWGEKHGSLSAAIDQEARRGGEFLEAMSAQGAGDAVPESEVQAAATADAQAAESHDGSRAFDGAGAAAARGFSTRSNSSSNSAAGAMRRTAGAKAGNVVFEEGSGEAATSARAAEGRA